MSTTTMVPGRDAPPHDGKEGRRPRALDLFEAGGKPIRIAEALGVSRGAVSQWLKAAREGGRAALRYRPLPGKTPRLTPEQRAAIPALLARGAEAHGFIGAVWTAARVAEVIRREFGVRSHPAHVSRLLRQPRWTPRKPLRRASQRTEAAIAAWSAERWPALEAQPPRRSVPSSVSMSRAAIRCRSSPAPPSRVGNRRCCGRR